MKKIGLQQWVVDLLCEDDVLEDKKEITSNDDLQYGKKKLTDSSSSGKYTIFKNNLNNTWNG